MTRPMLCGALLATLVACGGDDAGGLSDAKPVIEAYASLVEAGTVDSLTTATALRAAIAAFLAAPSDTTLGAARAAWVAARLPYRQTEAFRFYGGPIDDPADEREGRINAWPLDEASIDYVEGQASGGAINDTAGFPQLTVEAIVSANFQNGEADVKTGYHAIEFLLWGQDHDPNGPGARPAADYAGGAAANHPRRGQYLAAVAELLVTDLQHVRDGWADTAGTYRKAFVALAPEEALRRILTGIGTLAASELSGERMLTAYENKDQEDEHSCFSDTTRDDLIGNARGIDNVYHGRYGTLDGPGLDVLVAARDAALDAKMKTRLAAMMTAMNEIPAPFDRAILGADTDPGRVKVLAAVRATQDVGDTIVEVDLLGVEINTEL